MSKISSSLKLYVDELKDLWLANDQMGRALAKIAPQAQNPKLHSMLKQSQTGIAKHTEIVKSLIEAHGEVAYKKHCNGMQGLAAEAIKQTIQKSPESDSVRDAVIIAQHRRITYYGLLSFGKVWGFAKALQLTDDQTKLQSAVNEMYQSDELMRVLAESAVQMKTA